MPKGKFRQNLQGLLGGGDQLSNIGLGLLSSAGPRVPGTGNRLGEAFQFANMQNQAFQQQQLFQQQQEEAERQRQAQEQLQGFISGQGIVPISEGSSVNIPGLLGAPPVQAQIPGLLGRTQDLDPQQFNQGLLSAAAGVAPEQAAASILQSGLTPGAPRSADSAMGKLLTDLDAAEAAGNTFAANTLRSVIESELGPDVDLDDIRSTRNDVVRQSQSFLEAQDGFGRVVAAAESDSSGGHQALLFGIAKVLDPGSVVRGGELALTRDIGSIGQQLVASFRSAFEGKKLTDEQVAEWVEVARDQYQKIVTQQQRVIDDARDFADAHELGPTVIPEFVIPEVPDVKELLERLRSTDTAEQARETAGGVIDSARDFASGIPILGGFIDDEDPPLPPGFVR